MPALPTVANVLKYKITWTVEGDPLANTILHYHYTSGPPSDTDLTAFVVAMAAAVTAGLNAEYLASTTFSRHDVRDLSSDMGAVSGGTVDAIGTRAGSRLAPGTAALMNYGIRRSYRGGKPRGYWPIGASADVAATGFWTDAFVSEYGTAVADFIQAGIGSFGGMTVDNQCQVSYYGPPNRILTNPSTGRARTVSTRRDAPGGTGHPIVDIINTQEPTKVIGSQRRRNRNA
jgi:hypothetical protein